MFDEFDKTFGGVFPSPIGELHFSIMTGGTMGVEFVMFPSPIGELHFSMKLYLDNCHIYITFPSPIGELHFSIYESRSIVTSTGVSVPYRGATFLNPTELQWYVHSYIVSVPYRGATFLNTDKIFLTLQAHTFPSPIGELHFSIVILLSSVPLMIICFRPLSGSYISQ